MLLDALAALHAIAGVTAKVIPFPETKPRPPADALLEITVRGQKQLFVVEIRAIDRRIAVGQIRAKLQDLILRHFPGHHPLLTIGYATTHLAEECRRLELPFLGTAENLYSDTDNFLLYVRGQKRPDSPFKNEYRVTHPAGLKVAFALMCRPALADASYRDLVRIAQVGLGTVGPILKDLIQRRFLRKSKTQAKLERIRKLLNDWVTHYFPPTFVRLSMPDAIRQTETS